MMRRHSFAVVGLAVAAGAATSMSVQAQSPVDGMEFSVSAIKARGAMIAPVFEGWYQNADGTYSIVFGYHNLNTDQAVDIPLGPDNYLEPREFDGIQPTHFEPIPDNGARRQYGVFALVVPADWGDRDIVWHLNYMGYQWAIPGRITSAHYILDAVAAAARGTSAGTMKFEPSGEAWKGREGKITGPISARVGVPLPLSVWVNPDPRPRNIVWWFKHQGPGDVTFSAPEATVQGGAGDVEVSTTVTFSEPGDYMVRAVANESIGSIEFHCCWTNAYYRIRVAQ